MRRLGTVFMAVASPRAPHADQAVEPRNGWHERIRARRYDDMLRRVASAVHVDHAGPGEPAHAPDQSDAPIRQPFLLSRIRIAGHHVVPPVQRRLHVHLGAGADVAGALDRLPRTQEGLGRDARPVGALAADQLPLDDGDPKPTRRDGPGAVLAGRTAAQHDHVEIAHTRKLLAALFAHHVLGVPVGPVRVGPADALLVLSVGRLGAAQCRSQVTGGVERGGGRIEAAREAIGHLLEQPAVAVGVFERGKGVVALVIRIRPVDPITRPLRVELRSGRSGMEHPTNRGSPADKFVAPGFDVRHDQVQAMGRSGWRPRDVGAELHRTLRSRWRELHDPEAVVEGEVGVEPPAEAGVERLGAIGVGHGDDDRLELEIGRFAARRSAGCALSIDGAHPTLLCLVPK